LTVVVTPLYLKKMKRLCFNYLAQDHRVSSCQNSTRCWCCRQFERTSVKCPPSSSSQPSIICCNCNSKGVPIPPYIVRCTDTIFGDNLLMRSPSLAPCERMEDPMLLEALLMNQRLDTEEDISTTQCVISLSPKKSNLQCCLEVKRSNWLDRSLSRS
jgi:hypothetical protein